VTQGLPGQKFTRAEYQGAHPGKSKEKNKNSLQKKKETNRKEKGLVHKVRHRQGKQTGGGTGSNPDGRRKGPPCCKGHQYLPRPKQKKHQSPGVQGEPGRIKASQGSIEEGHVTLRKGMTTMGSRVHWKARPGPIPRRCRRT